MWIGPHYTFGNILYQQLSSNTKAFMLGACTTRVYYLVNDNCFSTLHSTYTV